MGKYHADLNTYLLSSDVVYTGFYFAECAFADILSYHVVTDAPTLVRRLLAVASRDTLPWLTLSFGTLRLAT